MTVRELIEQTQCEMYYIQEMDLEYDQDDCDEYMVSAEEVSEDILDCPVLDYIDVSNKFGVITVDVTDYDDEDEDYKDVIEVISKLLDDDDVTGVMVITRRN